MHISIIGSTTIILYLAAAFLLGRRLLRRDTSPASKWPGLGLAVLALAGHSYELFNSLFIGTGINLGVFNAISMLTWSIALMLIVGSLSRPMENLGILVFPGAGLALLAEGIFHSEHVLRGGNLPLEIHILISVFAYSMVSIAAVQALLLAIQDRHLRNRQPGGFVRALPPLQTMEDMLFKLITAGFGLQTLSLITGALFIENLFAQHMVHKTVFAVAAWLVFGTLIWGRRRFGWRGRTAIRWTLVGFASLALAYIGSKLVLEVILGR